MISKSLQKKLNCFILISLENPCNGGECRNSPGSFSCVCSGGLMMGPDASSCLDLDECTIDPEVNLIPLHLS